MPVATIGLFALAIVVLALAFLINRAVGGDGGDDLSAADRAATQFARTATQPGGGGADETPDTGNETPAGNETPGNNATTPAGGGDDETPTPGSGGTGDETYTVQPGDNCQSIATAHDLTLDEFYELNPDINEACSNLQLDQEVRVR